jgi:hypothetical protein
MAGKSETEAPRQLVTERITVGLIPKVTAELQQVQDRTGLSKTDIVNRAISLYEFLEGRLSSGDELLLRRAGGGELELIRLL